MSPFIHSTKSDTEQNKNTIHRHQLRILQNYIDTYTFIYSSYISNSTWISKLEIPIAIYNNIWYFDLIISEHVHNICNFPYDYYISYRCTLHSLKLSCMLS